MSKTIAYISASTNKQDLNNQKLEIFELGKPKGTIQKSKFDKDVVKIKELLDLGYPLKK